MIKNAAALALSMTTYLFSSNSFALGLEPLQAVVSSSELARITDAMGTQGFALEVIRDFGLSDQDDGSHRYSITYAKSGAVATRKTYYALGKAQFIQGSNSPIFVPVFCFRDQPQDEKCAFFNLEELPLRPY